jgi:hypothetical protein
MKSEPMKESMKEALQACAELLASELGVTFS